MPISKAWFENGSLVALFNEALNSHDKYYLLQHGQSEARMEVQQLIDWTVARFGQQ